MKKLSEELRNTCLYRFLRKEGVVQKFSRNVKNGGYGDLESVLTYDGDNKDVIARAFSWTDSPEQHHFWSAINSKYEKFCDNEKNKSV